MVDVGVSSSYGYRLGAVGKWAMDVEDPLSTAINDFPKRGILVNIFSFSGRCSTDSKSRNFSVALSHVGPGTSYAGYLTTVGGRCVIPIKLWLKFVYTFTPQNLAEFLP